MFTDVLSRTSRWVLAITVALVPVLSSALAGGNLGFRLEYPFSLRAYVEETLWRAEDLRVAAGVELRIPEMVATPYTVVVFDKDNFWVAVELAKPVPGEPTAFRFAVMGGLGW